MKSLRSHTIFFIAALGISLFVLTSTVKSQNHKPSDIIKLVSQTDSLSTFAKAIKAAGLAERFQGDGPYTLFAPTDKAFNKLPKSTLESLLKSDNKDKLVQILMYHIISRDIHATDFENGMAPKTAEGSRIVVSLEEKVKINEAVILKANLEAANGVVHIIDSVLMPPKRASAGE